MSNTAIKLNDVSKFYKLYDEPKDRLKEALHLFNKNYHKRYYALKGIDLEIREGDILGVVGRNGCGKSTLLKLITGVLQPDEGTISVKGKITALLELGAGFNPEFTGIDNIQFYAKVLGISDKDFEEKLPLITAFAELGDFLYQPVKTYSSGMKSRLGFAVAVHVDPEILILDEVLAVGDALFKRKCYAKMEEFFNAGKTIIYVSHDANSVNRICNRAVLIHEGNIIMDGEPKEVTKYYEKLLHSKEDNVQKVVTEIRSSVQLRKLKCSEEKIQDDLISISELNEGKPQPYFIPDLKSSSVVVYQNYDVEISDPEIRTLTDERVNVLVTNECYKYVYKVNFGVDAREVSLGFNLKEEKGVLVSAAALHLARECIPLVKKGAVLEVAWHFDCRLLPGSYYSSNGVSAIIDEERQFLTRVVDVLIFKVVNKADYITTGLVDLGQRIDVDILSLTEAK